MVGVFQALVLGVLQGITEWLPVSSSGHLVLLQKLMRVEVPVFFDIVLHLGTLLAVLAFYSRDFVEIIKSVLRTDFASEHGQLAVFIVLGSIPTAVVGFAFHDLFSKMFSSVLAVGVALIVTGFILHSTRGKSGRKEVGVKSSLLVGLAQGIAIIPGISRSGSTISTGLILGLERKKAARYSLLLSVPAIIGASILEPFMGCPAVVPIVPLAAGFLSAFVFGYLSIKILLNFLSHDSFHKFAYYCWLVGGLAVVSQVI
jgi:undecaprenyl-diphosphatase